MLDPNILSVKVAFVNGICNVVFIINMKSWQIIIASLSGTLVKTESTSRLRISVLLSCSKLFVKKRGEPCTVDSSVIAEDYLSITVKR